jgi:hypothetical protein
MELAGKAADAAGLETLLPQLEDQFQSLRESLEKAEWRSSNHHPTELPQ